MYITHMSACLSVLGAICICVYTKTRLCLINNNYFILSEYPKPKMTLELIEMREYSGLENKYPLHTHTQHKNS